MSSWASPGSEKERLPPVRSVEESGEAVAAAPRAARAGRLAVATSALGAAGSAGVAVLTSLCCAGPAVLAVLGTGGALAAAELAPWRPYLLGVSFALLGYAFWRAYRPVAAAGAAGGPACPVRTGRALRTILWGSLALTLVAALLPHFLS